MSGACVGVGGTLLPRHAEAARWGDYPADARSCEVPEARRARSVLEIFLFGGISPWETFYVVDEDDYGRAAGNLWWTFQEGPENVSEVYERCRVPGSGPLLQDFMRDENGVMVKLGPFLEPLRQRRDIVDRLRLHVLSHGLAPHILAVPLGLTGHRLGDPRLAGVGTAVQRYFQSHGDGATEPLAYLIRPLERNPIFGAAADVGLHPSSARPLTLHVGSDREFVDALNRTSLGDGAAASDALLRHYVSRYRRRLTWPGAARPVRSATAEEFGHSAALLQWAPGLRGAFTPDVLALGPGAACGESVPEAESLTQLKLAARLLTRPGGARHVTVADMGLIQPYDAGHDTHEHHVAVSFTNLTFLFASLAGIINRPGEGNPAKIDLDHTLVVINMEFGRSPGRQVDFPTGRNHYPLGYVTAMFGGPIGPAQKGIVGSLGPDGIARNGLVPADTRAAVLAALGVYPLDRDVFVVSDFPGSATREDVLLRAKQRVLGIEQ